MAPHPTDYYAIQNERAYPNDLPTRTVEVLPIFLPIRVFEVRDVKFGHHLIFLVLLYFALPSENSQLYHSREGK